MGCCSVCPWWAHFRHPGTRRQTGHVAVADVGACGGCWAFGPNVRSSWSPRAMVTQANHPAGAPSNYWSDPAFTSHRRRRRRGADQLKCCSARYKARRGTTTHTSPPSHTMPRVDAARRRAVCAIARAAWARSHWGSALRSFFPTSDQARRHIASTPPRPRDVTCFLMPQGKRGAMVWSASAHCGGGIPFRISVSKDTLWVASRASGWSAAGGPRGPIGRGAPNFNQTCCLQGTTGRQRGWPAERPAGREAERQGDGRAATVADGQAATAAGGRAGRMRLNWTSDRV